MVMFILACGVVIATGLLAAAQHPEGASHCLLAFGSGSWRSWVFGSFGSSICLRSRCRGRVHHGERGGAGRSEAAQSQGRGRVSEEAAGADGQEGR
jgi:hypothetical protein